MVSNVPLHGSQNPDRPCAESVSIHDANLSEEMRKLYLLQHENTQKGASKKEASDVESFHVRYEFCSSVNHCQRHETLNFRLIPLQYNLALDEAAIAPLLAELCQIAGIFHIVLGTIQIQDDFLCCESIVDGIILFYEFLL